MTTPITPISPGNITAPSVEIDVDGRKHLVIFDFDRLVAIEGTTGRTVLQTISEFSSYAPTVPEGCVASDEQSREAAERFSLTSVGKFVAGCLGIPPSEVGHRVPMGRIRDVFATLVPGFVDAVRQLSGSAEPAADPSAAPQTSAA